MAEFAVNMLTDGPAPQASVCTLQRRGGVEAQRAPAHRLCSELSRGALEGRHVLARQSGHQSHRGLQLGMSLPAPRTTEVLGA